MVAEALVREAQTSVPTSQGVVWPSKAGDLWADRLGVVLKARGFETVDNWPSFNYKDTPKGLVIIDVYVDDLVMYGSKSAGGLRAEIDEVRKHIRMDDPAPLGRYLGVNGLP